jgi:hypothetical protein
MTNGKSLHIPSHKGAVDIYEKTAKNTTQICLKQVQVTKLRWNDRY